MPNSIDNRAHHIFNINAARIKPKLGLWTKLKIKFGKNIDSLKLFLFRAEDAAKRDKNEVVTLFKQLQKNGCIPPHNPVSIASDRVHHSFPMPTALPTSRKKTTPSPITITYEPSFRPVLVSETAVDFSSTTFSRPLSTPVSKTIPTVMPIARRFEGLNPETYTLDTASLSVYEPAYFPSNSDTPVSSQVEARKPKRVELNELDCVCIHLATELSSCQETLKAIVSADGSTFEELRETLLSLLVQTGMWYEEEGFFSKIRFDAAFNSTADVFNQIVSIAINKQMAVDDLIDFLRDRPFEPYKSGQLKEVFLMDIYLANAVTQRMHELGHVYSVQDKESVIQAIFSHYTQEEANALNIDALFKGIFRKGNAPIQKIITEEMVYRRSGQNRFVSRLKSIAEHESGSFSSNIPRLNRRLKLRPLQKGLEGNGLEDVIDSFVRPLKSHTRDVSVGPDWDTISITSHQSDSSSHLDSSLESKSEEVAPIRKKRIKAGAASSPSSMDLATPKKIASRQRTVKRLEKSLEPLESSYEPSIKRSLYSKQTTPVMRRKLSPAEEVSSPFSPKFKTNPEFFQCGGETYGFTMARVNASLMTGLPLPDTELEALKDFEFDAHGRVANGKDFETNPPIKELLQAYTLLLRDDKTTYLDNAKQVFVVLTKESAFNKKECDYFQAWESLLKSYQVDTGFLAGLVSVSPKKTPLELQEHVQALIKEDWTAPLNLTEVNPYSLTMINKERQIVPKPETIKFLNYIIELKPDDSIKNPVYCLKQLTYIMAYEIQQQTTRDPIRKDLLETLRDASSHLQILFENYELILEQEEVTKFNNALKEFEKVFTVFSMLLPQLKCELMRTEVMSPFQSKKKGGGSPEAPVKTRWDKTAPDYVSCQFIDVFSSKIVGSDSFIPEPLELVKLPGKYPVIDLNCESPDLEWVKQTTVKQKAWLEDWLMRSPIIESRFFREKVDIDFLIERVLDLETRDKVLGCFEDGGHTFVEKFVYPYCVLQARLEKIEDGVSTDPLKFFLHPASAEQIKSLGEGFLKFNHDADYAASYHAHLLVGAILLMKDPTALNGNPIGAHQIEILKQFANAVLADKTTYITAAAGAGKTKMSQLVERLVAFESQQVKAVFHHAPFPSSDELGGWTHLPAASHLPELDSLSGVTHYWSTAEAFIETLSSHASLPESLKKSLFIIDEFDKCLAVSERLTQLDCERQVLMSATRNAKSLEMILERKKAKVRAVEAGLLSVSETKLAKWKQWIMDTTEELEHFAQRKAIH